AFFTGTLLEPVESDDAHLDARAGPAFAGRELLVVVGDGPAGGDGKFREAPTPDDADAAELALDVLVQRGRGGRAPADARAQVRKQLLAPVGSLRGEVGAEERNRGAEQGRTLLGHEQR